MREHLSRGLILLIMFSGSAFSVVEESGCTGTTSKGSLVNGVKLPLSGKNYVSYSTITWLAGRTYVHNSVRRILLDAYKRLEVDQPGKVYKYAETGFKNGGDFKPHKTHQNGLSVDFMTPVTDSEGESVHLPSHPFNRFGYDIEFNLNGEYENLNIDYEALAAHIVALHKSAKAIGFDIWRVIFDLNLQPNLFQTQYADYLNKYITFSTRPSWVRHDEHYHVDFIVPCKEENSNAK